MYTDLTNPWNHLPVATKVVVCFRDRGYGSNVDTFEVTEATRAEEALVWSSWLRSYRDSLSQGGQSMPAEAYYPWQRGRIADLLGSGARVLVARDPSVDGFVYGWLCCDRVGGAFRLHWAYVKHQGGFRRQRVFSELLASALERLGVEDERLVYTHRPRRALVDVLERMGFAYEPMGRRERSAA